MQKPGITFDFVPPTPAPADGQANPGQNGGQDPTLTPVDPIDDPEPNPTPGQDPNGDPTPGGNEGGDPDGNPEPDGNLFTELNGRLGLEIAGEFEDSTEGLTNYVKEASTKMMQGALEAVFSQMPDVQEYMEYRQNGGEPNKFFQHAFPDVDYSTMEIGQEDVGAQREVIRTLMKKQGHDPNYINETLSDYAAANILEKHAKHAIKSLAAMQQSEKANVIESQRIEAEAAREDARKNWESIQKVVSSGNLQQVVIPETEKQGFLDWISKPIDNKGNTRRDVDRESMGIETALLLEYMIYKKADISKLVLNNKRTTAAATLSSRIGSKGVSQRMSGNGSGGTKTPVTLPKLNEIF